MQDRFVISSEIEIDTQSPHPSSSDIDSNQGLDTNQRLRTAVALIDLLRDAGLDCHLVAHESGDSAQASQCDADESLQPKIAKPPLQ